MKTMEIPRRIYRLPRREIERLAEEVRGGLDGDGKSNVSFYHPPSVSPKLLNDERLTVQIKVNITYKDRSVSFYEKNKEKPNVKKTYSIHQAIIERIEWVPEGLLLVPHGSPYHENPDLLIVPEDDRVTDYMPYEQCNRCKLDHCCWSNGSFIWEDGNTPNSCKEFIPMEEEE